MENLQSKNRQSILEILDGLRERALNDELLQIFTVTEAAEGFEACWSGSEDRFGISAFVLASALTRMGFAKAPDQSTDSD